ncbi:MAG: DnaA/Hda family protein [Nitrospinota bacterium]|nr:DnaA/Hda family protein [Nitrospinota bacterium]
MKSDKPSQLRFGLTLPEKTLFSLGRFIEGEHNAVPLEAARRFTREGNIQSLVIFGSRGSGKSHLLKGMAINIADERSTAVVDAAEMLNKRKIREEMKNLAGYQVVCIDNLDALSGTPELFDEVFHLFNELTGKGGFFAATMEESPARGGNMPDYLYTRLLSGLIVAIERPGDAEKGEILKKLAADRQIELSQKEVKYILEHSARSIGDLVGLLGRLESMLGKGERNIGIQHIKEAMSAGEIFKK